MDMDEDIIAEINFLKALIDKNLEIVRKALEIEETSSSNHQRQKSAKIVEKNLRPNSFKNWRVEMPHRNSTYEEIMEHKCYLTGKKKEMKARFLKEQNKFTELENKFNISRTKFLNLRLARSNEIDWLKNF